MSSTLTIRTPSGKKLDANIGLMLEVDVISLSKEDWHFCEDHAVFYRLDDAFHEVVLYLGGPDERDSDELMERLGDYGCPEDLKSLVETAVRLGAAWLLIHK